MSGRAARRIERGTDMIVGTVDGSSSAPLWVSELASRKASWAAARQATIAGNIANADTPEYRARDIAPFNPDPYARPLQMSRTHALHMELTDLERLAEAVDETGTWDIAHSGNTVSIDEEMIKSGQASRDHQMSVAVMSTFHRMMLSAVSFR